MNCLMRYLMVAGLCFVLPGSVRSGVDIKWKRSLERSPLERSIAARE